MNGRRFFQSQELGVTYSAIGFSSLNTRRPVSVSSSPFGFRGVAFVPECVVVIQKRLIQ
jgi:hypothetical protein